VASFACAALLSQVSMTTAAASAFMSFRLLAKLWRVLQHVLYVALQLRCDKGAVAMLFCTRQR